MAEADELEAERANSSRVHLRSVIAEFAASLPIGARVIDVGGGTGRYAHLFADQTYEVADRTPTATHVCDMHTLPLPDEAFDAGMTTQTLEFAIDPPRVLAELRRVLKPGAPVLITGPFIYQEERDDYYRFTSLGFTRLVENAGFVDVRLTPLEGLFGTLGYLLRLASDLLGRVDIAGYEPDDSRIVRKAENDLSQLGEAFNAMDLTRKEVSAGLALNHVIHARRG